MRIEGGLNSGTRSSHSLFQSCKLSRRARPRNIRRGSGRTAKSRRKVASRVGRPGRPLAHPPASIVRCCEHRGRRSSIPQHLPLDKQHASRRDLRGPCSATILPPQAAACQPRRTSAAAFHLPMEQRTRRAERAVPAKTERQGGDEHRAHPVVWAVSSPTSELRARASTDAPRSPRRRTLAGSQRDLPRSDPTRRSAAERSSRSETPALPRHPHRLRT